MAAFADAFHMKVAFGLIVVLFIAVGFSFFSGSVTGQASAQLNGEGNWECLSTQCSSYENVTWEQWAVQNCYNQQTEQGKIAICPINANGVRQAVPLQNLIAAGTIQPQQCAEVVCTKEVYVRDSRYVVG